MDVRLCICNGMYRSGSTWSFNVCRALYQVLGGDQNRSQSGYMNREPLEQLILTKLPAITFPLVVKSHDVGSAAITALRGGHARAVCTFRDPRDAVASDMKFMNHPFETAVKRISASLESLHLLQSIPHVLLVSYERMMTDPHLQIRRIADHLGVKADESTVRQIDAKTNLENSQRVCETLKTRHSRDVYQSPLSNHRIDPSTHLHDNHINGGTIGRWKDELSIDRAIHLTELLAPWLLKLGYETEATVRSFAQDACIRNASGTRE
jgi:hypothetical protein